jgi:hypothetical protein
MKSDVSGKDIKRHKKEIIKAFLETVNTLF